MTQQITVVGGGIAGLTAAIRCAEAGMSVRLCEAHDALGGRARGSEGRHKANLGPHVLYKDGPLWRWLRERKLLPAHASPPLGGIRARLDGELRRTPPLAAIPSVLRLRGRQAPVELDFRGWAQRHAAPRPRRCCQPARASTRSITTLERSPRRSCGRARCARR